MSSYWGVLWAAAATAAFTVIFNVRGRDIPASALGGAIGWLVFLLAGRWGQGMAFLVSSMAVAVYSELAGNLFKRPATLFLVSALMPLVPGGGMYYMMSEALTGNLDSSMKIGLMTLTSAGAIAAGLAVGSAAMRLTRRGQ